MTTTNNFLAALMLFTISVCSAQTADQVKQQSVGSWESIAPEIRPSTTGNPENPLKPFYLLRKFSYAKDGTFDLIVVTNGDAYGKVPLARMSIKGHTEWRGDHPIAKGAQKVDFTADIEYTVTPLAQGLADVCNKYTKGFNEWKIGETQSILKRSFPPFGLTEGQLFKEYDLIYIFNGMMFWGARNIDGRGFDTEENRPTNLQIPMVKAR